MRCREVTVEGTRLGAQRDEAGAVVAVGVGLLRGEEDRVQAGGEGGPVGQEGEEGAEFRKGDGMAMVRAGIFAKQDRKGARGVVIGNGGEGARGAVLAAGFDGGGGFDGTRGDERSLE